MEVETPNMIPWWIVPMLGEEPKRSGIDSRLFIDSLNDLLRIWSYHIGIKQVEGGSWWHIEPFSAPPPQEPKELLRNLGSYFFNPLQRSSASPPKITGDLDGSKLCIALIGSLCDQTTRAYCYCLAKLLRWRSQTIFGPRSIQLLAFLYLPQDTHLREDRDEIAGFVSDLNLLMEQALGQRPFDCVFFIQDSNYSFINNPTGYQSLTRSQLTELLVQNLFHLMIGESNYFNQQVNRDQPCYMAMGSAALYYDLSQHRQKLALQAGSELLRKFSVAKDPPYVNDEEAEAVVERVGAEISSKQVLKRLDEIAVEFHARHQSLSDTEEDLDQKKEWEASAHLESLYWRLMKRTETFWTDEQGPAAGKVAVIKGMREIFAGRYGLGNARSLEQSLRALDKLKTHYIDADYQDALRQLRDPAWWDQAALQELLTRTKERPSDRKNMDDQMLSAIIPLLLFQTGLEVGVIAGLASLIGGAGYWVYKRLSKRLKDINGEIADLKKPVIRRLPLTVAEKEALRKDVCQMIEPILKDFSYKAQRTFVHLEGYMSELRQVLQSMEARLAPDDAFQSTAFFRSVFDDWTVPGRTASTSLMKADLVERDLFAPQLQINDRRVRFTECGERDLHYLLNQVFEENREAGDLLLPERFEEKKDDTLSSREAARGIAGVFGRYGKQLYESMSYSMDDALQHINAQLGKKKFVEMLKRLTAPPVILSAASMALAPLHFEWKYQDTPLLKAMVNEAVVKQISNVNEDYTPTLKSNVLSVAIYQPIRVNGGFGGASLDSIHTISELKNTIPADKLLRRHQASTAFLVSLATCSNDTLAAYPFDVQMRNEIRSLRGLLNDMDAWRIGNPRGLGVPVSPSFAEQLGQLSPDLHESKAAPYFIQEISDLELHLRVTFDGQVDQNRLHLGRPIKLRITPLKHVQASKANVNSKAIETKFQVDEADIMLWATTADVEPPWQTLRLNEALNTPLLFTITPKVEGKLVITLMLLVRNEPVYESEIRCEVLPLFQLEGEKETIEFKSKPESDPTSATDKKSEQSPRNHNHTPEDV